MMNKRPVIGIPSKIQNRKQDDLWHRQEVVDELRYLVVENGGMAIMLMPSQKTYDFNESDLGDPTILSEEEKEMLHQQVDLCDGIILQGGDYSNEYEVEIARYALKKDLPMIGICAGFNNILRALGSNIHEDMSRSHSHYVKDYRHPIRIEKDTLLYELIGKEKYEVNSLHTMIADRSEVEGYGRIAAYSEDGLVESFDLPDHRFVLAVKWHPELMDEEEYVSTMFKRFIEACKDRKEEKR